MKKIFVLSLILAPYVATSHAAVNWWEQETVCRVNPTKCYSSMGPGFVADEWDKDSECRGKKIVCGMALTPASDSDWPLSKKVITARTGINPDFDINILNGGCFGARKTISNGSQASYDDKYVSVFCPGILEQIYDYDIIEHVATGAILKRATQPTCRELAEYGYAHVKNDRCYGKRYAEREYYIDCSRGDDNVRLIVLNGANYEEPMGNNPHTLAQANEIFEEMIEIAKKLRN